MALQLGDTAPDFEAETTEGPMKFHDWIGDGERGHPVRIGVDLLLEEDRKVGVDHLAQVDVGHARSLRLDGQPPHVQGLWA